MILVILEIFPIFGNKKKNHFIMKNEKKIWYRTWMGYCPIELRAGALGRAGDGRGACAAGCVGRAAGALLGARSSRGTGAVRATMHSLGVAWCTGWASLGLMQPVWVLTWVFDSVVFLSHRLNSVHEHCSLQKNFPKKIKILNSNKIK